MNQRAAALGYQQITTALSAAVGLTLPVGVQKAQGTACDLLNRRLTVGGTVTGAFGVGQIVQGTGIPANTSIVSPGTLPNTWILSAACTTETGETVTAYAPVACDFAIIKCTAQTVMWRDDGVAPTATIGMPMLVTDPPLEYGGALANIQFIQATASAVLDVSYYKLAG